MQRDEKLEILINRRHDIAIEMISLEMNEVANEIYVKTFKEVSQKAIEKHKNLDSNNPICVCNELFGDFAYSVGFIEVANDLYRLEIENRLKPGLEKLADYKLKDIADKAENLRVYDKAVELYQICIKKQEERSMEVMAYHHSNRGGRTGCLGNK